MDAAATVNRARTALRSLSCAKNTSWSA